MQSRNFLSVLLLLLTASVPMFGLPEVSEQSSVSQDENAYAVYEAKHSDDPVIEELEVIAQENKQLVYVPVKVIEAIETIYKAVGTDSIQPELEALYQAAQRSVPAVTEECALTSIEQATKLLQEKASLAGISAEDSAKYMQNLERYKADIHAKEAQLEVEPITRRRKNKIFCRLFVRDFINAQSLSVASCIKTRSLLATSNVCIEGNLLVNGDLKVNGQICGLTGLVGPTGATGATGPIGPTGECICTGITGGGCLALGAGCDCLSVVQATIPGTVSLTGVLDLDIPLDIPGIASVDLSAGLITVELDDSVACTNPTVFATLSAAVAGTTVGLGVVLPVTVSIDGATLQIGANATLLALTGLLGLDVNLNLMVLCCQDL